MLALSLTHWHHLLQGLWPAQRLPVGSWWVLPVSVLITRLASGGNSPLASVRLHEGSTTVKVLGCRDVR